ncbi:dephospho-CoA kinase, partial [candidate division KSB1 bacterium]|nr:dephospho-CoA kinase [candidate division KSB1 bacterium]
NRPSRAPYVALDAALIYELHIENQLDKIIVVTAPLQQRLQRIMERDGLSQEQAQMRIAGQWPLEEKAQRADYVIHNDSTPTALTKKVKNLHNWIMAAAQMRGNG